MAFKFSSTISQLTLLGFLLTMLPLVAAIIHTNWKVDLLAKKMHTVVASSTEASETSRMIQNTVLSLERSAGQYLVLNDDYLLRRYKDHRVQLNEAMQHLKYLKQSSHLVSLLEQLKNAEQVLYEQLQQSKHASPEQIEELTLAIRQLADLTQPLPLEISRTTSIQRKSIDRKVTDIQRVLVWQVLALIPLAFLLMIVISFLLTRPMQQLKLVIHRLGDGELSTPVNVTGPQDIRELGQRLDWLRLRLAEIDEQKLLFLQHVSHELKTPLTGIREGTELLLDGVIGDLISEQTEVMQIIRDSSLQLQAQVEGLLGFNSALLQNSPAGNQILRVDQLLDEVIAEHELTVRPRQIELVSKVDSAETKGDKEQLRILFSTLISNAIKFSPIQGTIYIKSRQMNNIIVIDIIDSGPGVHKDDEKQIFKPFFQGQNKPKTHVKGTGLGLAIANRYADLHNGKIILKATKTGAHFRILLPTAENIIIDRQALETDKLEIHA